MKPNLRSTVAALALASGALLFLTGCPTTNTPPPAPKLVNDWYLQNQPGSRALSFAEDKVLAGDREKTIWATIDPNNTFVTRVVVEWGDALPDQQAEVPHVLVDPLEPRTASARFTGDPAAYSTAPDTWGLKLRLRGNGPDTTIPGGPRTVTGNPGIDAFLADVGFSSRIPERQVEAEGMPAGSRLSYTLHVFFKREPRADAPELGVYFPLRLHTYGPTISLPDSTAAGRATRLSWGDLRRVTNAGRSDLTDAGDEFEVDLRIERAVAQPMTIHFYSDPAAAIQFIDATGQPVTNTRVQPAPSSGNNPYLQRWRIRVNAAQLAAGQGVIWAHASGYAAASFTLP